MVTSGEAYALAKEGSTYVFYLPQGGAVDVDLSSSAGDLLARWFDPRKGRFASESGVKGGRTATFTAPDAEDWVLVIAVRP